MTYCRYASVTPVTVYIAAAIRGYATGCRMTVIHYSDSHTPLPGAATGRAHWARGCGVIAVAVRSCSWRHSAKHAAASYRGYLSYPRYSI